MRNPTSTFIGLLFIFYSLFFVAHPVLSQAQTIAAFTSGMQKQAGYLPFYWDAKKGKIYLEIDKFDTEILYYPTLAQGVGSNDIGLDRGRLGDEHIVSFKRSGSKVLMVEPNYRYRAITNDSLERRAVAESFAESVLWGFEIAAEEGSRTLVDLTPMLMQDAVGAIQDISRAKQGAFKLDPSRCAIYLPRTKNFPQNTEFEVTITLTGDSPGGYLRQVVPTPSAVTVRQHHSFVQLPGPGFKKREFDPRVGYNGIEYFDYATPVSQPITKRYIARHRLEKKDPSAAVSDPVKPIIYYLDPGTPEPIRSALMEGTAWWNQAYEAAGYRNAFQVKLLPADADPMDARYNVIQWVHRSTRGWSYGASLIDPRTGEIIKGKVTLGSLRVRQDYLIAQGLVGNFDNDSSHVNEMMGMSLARLRQLAAHEVGHTLGLPHNYIASTQNRASVMDYPTMVAKIKGASIDLSDAYTKEIGDYDKWSIIWGYQDFPKGANEKQELNKIVQQMHAKGLTFLTDQDARPEGSVHPETHLWDNGSNATEELQRVMQVRKLVMGNFNEKKIPAGTPMATIEEVFVPMYMFHRYQVEGAAKVIGGMSYSNALRGDGQVALAPVPAAEQNKALTTLLTTLDPQFLAVPDAVLKLIPPRPYRFGPNPREVFKRRTGLTFDPLGPPEAAAGMTLRLLLNPERSARLVRQGFAAGNLPTYAQVLDKLLLATYGQSQAYNAQKNDKSYAGEIRRMVQQKVLEQLMQLAVDKEVDGGVRLATHNAIMRIKSYAGTNTDYLSWLINQYENSPETIPAGTALAPPDGAPIDPGQEWLQPDCEWTER
ncbi:zinc-dependent metalloprotease [Tellurirhabdus bombi]|uniref:zinc-dependent metalloprotease n=1 Tax=Tellurirhabdus bombi TaxID=2907205 RepID=UPI001F298B54|nr:zinc-dependent metalloprotease [Tellurirhabdus bombi]